MPLERYLTPELLLRVADIPFKAIRRAEDVSSGEMRGVRSGDGVEFYERLQYAPGMDARRIDWKFYAKSERLHVKTFERESNAAVTVFLDVSASMKGFSDPYDENGKFLYAARAALIIAYCYHRERIPVTFVLFDSAPQAAITPEAGAHALRHIADALDNAPFTQPSETSAFPRALIEFVRPRADSFVISDFFFADLLPLSAFVTAARAMNAHTTLLQTITPEEKDFPFTRPSAFIDSETGEKIVVYPNSMRKEYQKAFEDRAEALGAIAYANAGAYREIKTNLDVVHAALKGMR